MLRLLTTHKKAVGGDESPTAIQDMETYECGTFPQSQNYLCDPMEAKNFAGNFFRSWVTLSSVGKLGVFIYGDWVFTNQSISPVLPSGLILTLNEPRLLGLYLE